MSCLINFRQLILYLHLHQGSLRSKQLKRGSFPIDYFLFNAKSTQPFPHVGTSDVPFSSARIADAFSKSF